MSTFKILGFRNFVILNSHNSVTNIWNKTIYKTLLQQFFLEGLTLQWFSYKIMKKNSVNKIIDYNL